MNKILPSQDQKNTMYTENTTNKLNIIGFTREIQRMLHRNIKKSSKHKNRDCMEQEGKYRFNEMNDVSRTNTKLTND